MMPHLMRVSCVNRIRYLYLLNEKVNMVVLHVFQQKCIPLLMW